MVYNGVVLVEFSGSFVGSFVGTCNPNPTFNCDLEN